MLNIILRAGAIGAGAASLYGSGSTNYAAPAPQHCFRAYFCQKKFPEETYTNFIIQIRTFAKFGSGSGQKSSGSATLPNTGTGIQFFLSGFQIFPSCNRYCTAVNIIPVPVLLFYFADKENRITNLI
jgi:hypothetical protein